MCFKTAYYAERPPEELREIAPLKENLKLKKRYLELENAYYMKKDWEDKITAAEFTAGGLMIGVFAGLFNRKRENLEEEIHKTYKQ